MSEGNSLGIACMLTAGHKHPPTLSRLCLRGGSPSSVCPSIPAQSLPGGQARTQNVLEK